MSISPPRLTTTPTDDRAVVRRIREAMPREVFVIDERRAIAIFARNVALIGACFAGIVLVLRADLPAVARVGLALPLAALEGFGFWGLFAVGHDAVHRSFLKDRRWNDGLGEFCMAVNGMNFAAGRSSHGLHHRYTSNVDHSEGGQPGYRDVDAGPGTRAYATAITTIPFVAYMIFLWKGDYASWLRPNTTGTTDLERATRHSFRLVVLLHGGLFLVVAGLLDPVAWALGVLVPFWWSGALFIITAFLHHNDPDSVWHRDSTHSFERGVLSTRDRSYGRAMDVLLHNQGLHLVHHLLPKIPHYHLPRATAAVSSVVPAHDVRPTRLLWDYYRIRALYLTYGFRRRFELERFTYRELIAARSEGGGPGMLGP